ncbi:MAG: CPBP family intramembrane metalloprotease [Pyrinomonadaceae bacterium]|nr:CPBP family intramembrane metalloprotease [Pyrinomonadaceae bacterium]
MENKNSILFDETGRLRSGWRVGIFLFAFIFFAIVLGSLGQIMIRMLAIDAVPGSPVFMVSNAILSLIPALFVGWMCGKLLEKLPFRALGAAFTRGWLKHFAVGLALGMATLGIAVFIAYVFGGMRFEFNTSDTTIAILGSLASAFVVFAAASAFEEILFRGYVLQTLSRSGLAWLAILLTSVFFGAVHFGNPDAGLISTANTILAGLWFSVAYLKTRDLWFAWGLHLMWNFAQGAVFGIEVSGLTALVKAPLLKEIDTGPHWLTGTTYGVEGGIVCTIALVVSIAAIWFLPILKPDPELLSMTSPTTSLSPTTDH